MNQQVGSQRIAVFGISSPPETSLYLRPDTVGFHDPGNPVLPTPCPITIDFRRDPRTPIDSPAAVVNLSYLFHEALIVLFSVARQPFPPLIITTPGDPQDFTHPLKLKCIPVLFHKPV